MSAAVIAKVTALLLWLLIIIVLLLIAAVIGDIKMSNHVSGSTVMFHYFAAFGVLLFRAFSHKES